MILYALTADDMVLPLVQISEKDWDALMSVNLTTDERRGFGSLVGYPYYFCLGKGVFPRPKAGVVIVKQIEPEEV